MKKVSLGKPLATTVTGKVDWILRALHEIELASSVRDPELDAIDASFADLDVSLTAIETRLNAIESRLDGIDTSIVDIEARLDVLEP